jgi:RNA polymerase sigma factor (sigma-70 family)
MACGARAEALAASRDDPGPPWPLRGPGRDGGLRLLGRDNGVNLITAREDQSVEPTPREGCALAGKGEEELVELVQRGACPTARDELIARHQEWVRRLIAALAKDTDLSAADVEDAQQDAFLRLLQCLERYKVQRRETGPSRLRGFLRVVLTNGFKDFAKRLLRSRRQESALCAAEGPSGLPPGTAGATRACRPTGTDPDGWVVRDGEELAAALRDALNRLSGSQLWVVDQWMAGKSLRALAREQATTYYEVHRRWLGILTELRAALKDWIE